MPAASQASCRAPCATSPANWARSHPSCSRCERPPSGRRRIATLRRSRRPARGWSRDPESIGPPADDFAWRRTRHLARPGAGSERRIVRRRRQRRRLHQQGTAAEDDREVQQLRSAHPGQPGPQQGDRLAGEERPGRRAQRPLAIVQAVRLVSPHSFQARPRPRHRRRRRAQRHPAQWVEGERLRRRSGSLVQADREEGRGGPARLSRAGSGDHRRECGGQGGRP